MSQSRMDVQVSSLLAVEIQTFSLRFVSLYMPTCLDKGRFQSRLIERIRKPKQLTLLTFLLSIGVLITLFFFSIYLS